ncbi:TPA: hypothetical protein ACGJVD_002719 [Pseudomonas aeruginosa]|uniref:hypothetical protein n=1 Tax=Pseudomonas aeruginosa TaxID=287 RepID=UPI000A826B39|nr:hypothetical protein [Pseudomonas aeruginosa]
MSKELNKAPVEQAEPASCQGTNCGTTTGDHSSECLAEAAASQGWELKPGDLCGRDCPMRPDPVEQAGGDERAVDGKPRATKCPDCGEGDLMPGDLCACGYETDPAAGYACSECDGSGDGYVGEVCRECDGSGWFVTPEQARAALAQPSPKCATCNDSGQIVVSGPHYQGEFQPPEYETEPCDMCAQPSPAQAEQAEAERPEVVARVVHSNPVVLGQCGPLNANDELMTVAQHAASVARWAEMFNRVEQQRDAAMARVAELEAHCVRLGQGGAERYWENRWRDADARLQELEKQEPVATVAKVPGEDWNSLDFHRDLQDMQPGTKLYTAPVAQAQHSVPDGTSDLCRFLAKLYCELDGLRYSTAKLPAEQIADALIFKWPVLQGARNQLNIKRISEQPYDESKLHSAIAAMLAAAPGKEVGHE